MIKIRSLARIDKFTAELNRIWKKYLNFLGWIAHEKKLDPFFIEENKAITYLKEYCGEEADDNGQV